MATVFDATVAPQEAAATTLPERIGLPAAQFAVAADAIVLLVATTLAALLARDVRGAIAATAIVALIAVVSGRYRISFALRPRDELYAAVAIACEAAPFAILATMALDTSYVGPALCVALSTAGLAATGIAACSRRRGTSDAFRAYVPYLDRVGRKRARSHAQSGLLRALDIALALAACALLLPVMLAIAAVVALDSKGPVLFMQRRVGRHDRQFTMLKFRTMRADAGNDWVKPGDDRITRIGAFLRRSSLDELPQLFNVLAGDMSLVGPRPEMAEYAEQFEMQVRNYPDRHIIRPGITGWAQLHCPRNLQPSDMPVVLMHDLFYVQNVGIHLYVLSLVQTVFEVFFQHAV